MIRKVLNSNFAHGTSQNSCDEGHVGNSLVVIVERSTEILTRNPVSTNKLVVVEDAKEDSEHWAHISHSSRPLPSSRHTLRRPNHALFYIPTTPANLELYQEEVESIDAEAVKASNVPALAILDWVSSAITEAEDAAAAAEAAEATAVAAAEQAAADAAEAAEAAAANEEEED